MTMRLVNTQNPSRQQIRSYQWLILVILLGIVTLLTISAKATKAADGINRQINYYGVLKTSSGAVVADGKYDVVFKIYNAGGSVAWVGTYTADNGNPVTVKNGNFSVMLGSGTGNKLNVDFSQDTYYLGITVGDDKEMTPRQRLGSAPYAFNSDAVDGVSIYKVSANPNTLGIGSAGDIALDIVNEKMYFRIPYREADDSWAEVGGPPEPPTFTSLTDILITSPQTNDVLTYSSGKWINRATGSITSATSGVTITGGGSAVLGTGVSISIANADGTHTGLLTSTDWNTFNTKENALTFSGALSRTGNAISANQADGSTNGFLSSTDWNTFNTKENGLTFSGTLSRVGNTISQAQSSGSTSGYLSSTDWNTFNDKVSSQWGASGSGIAYSGKVAVGTTSPTAGLHLGAGTSTAGTAPLKIDAGTLLATAEAGAIEFDGDNLYYTDDGATPQRHILAKDEIYFNTSITEPSITYQHPRDPSELNGDTGYTYSGFTTYGMYEQMPVDTTVSSILANVWCTNTNRDVTLKVFVRDNLTVFNPDSVTPDYSGTISHTVMPHASTSGGYEFAMSSNVTVQAGQYLMVMWQSSTGGEVNVSFFTSDSGSAPSRHSFIIGAANSNFTYTSLDTSVKYFATSFRVYGNTDITRTTTSAPGMEITQNSSFETAGAGGADVWSSWGEWIMAGGTIEDTTVAAEVHSGSHAAKITSAGGIWFTPQVSYSIPVTAGEDYQVSFWTRGDGTHAGKYSLYGYTGCTTYINGSGSGLTTGVTGTTYAQVTTTFTAPAGCTAVLLYLVPDNSGAGYPAYFDDVSIKQFVDVVTLQPLSIQTILNNLPSAAITFSDPDGIMTSTNVQDAIIEAYNHAGTYTPVVPRIVLPDNVYGVVGDKLQLFVRGMIEAQNPYNLPYVLNSTVGSSYPRYFEYTPVLADVGTKTFTAKVLDYDYSTLTTKTINIKVANPTGQPASNQNILCLGDSLTAGGVWPAELYRRLTQSGGSPAGLAYGNITFIGDKAMTSYPTQGYTGFGGWTYGDYNGTSMATYGHVLTGTFDKDKTDVGSTWTDGSNTWMIVYATGGLKIYGSGTLAASGTLTHVSGASHTGNIVYTAKTDEPASPFWDSGAEELSFSNWFSRNSFSGTINAVYVLLGWNGRASNQTDFTAEMATVRTFLDQLHSEYPSTIVRIVGIQMPSSSGGLGYNYGANGGYSEYYGMVRSANGLNTAYQSLANEAAYSSWVQFISIAPQFDSEYNMPQDTAVDVNSRNTTHETRGTNGVHPDTSGYYQIADAVYREFVYTFVSD